MSRLIDLTGQVFGDLTVLYRDENKTARVWWVCKCGCGNTKSVPAVNLRKGKTKSCGCYLKNLPVGKAFKHGKINTPEYKSWSGMKERCLNPNHAAYDNYGGRGITVQGSWIDDFRAFYEYIGPKPGKTYSLDRIDCNGNYEEGNVRWATKKEQSRNRRLRCDSSSGVTGVRKVSQRVGNHVYPTWIARWQNIDGSRGSKAFSVNKYGDELAEFLAINVREKRLWELNKLGQGYTPDHGK